MQMSCDVIGHVMALDQSEPSKLGHVTALDQSEAYPKSAPARGRYGVIPVAPPGGNKRTTNQNAPFKISTNQKVTQNLHIFMPSDAPIYY